MRTKPCSSIRKSLFLLLLPTLWLPAQAGRRYRLLHNNDGTDILANYWHNRRPISIADVEECVDLVAESGVTTYLICTGSDFTYYRSRYGRIFGDDEGGTLESFGDTIFLKYYRHHLLLEQEGTDMIRTCLSRARTRGMEAMITYRMNDLHLTDPKYRGTAYGTKFWSAHPEYWLRDSTQGWNSAGALDFSLQEVRDHKLRMISEQLDLYGDLLDGYELDFMRMIVYFRSGEGERNAPLMTDLVRRIRARVDSLSSAQGRRVLLTARVPVEFDDAVSKGLDVKRWVDEGLVDFLTLGVHWCSNPAVDTDAFRGRLGRKGRRIPIYASVDDGGFAPRGLFSHGTFRGAADFALAHGADGMYLFNFYLDRYLQQGRKVYPVPGTEACRTRSLELIGEMSSRRTLRGRNKIYAWYVGENEYQLHYNTPLPMPLPGEATLPSCGPFRGKARPLEAVLLIRTDCPPEAVSLSYAGVPLERMDEGTVLLYHRNAPIAPGEYASAFSLPVKLLRRRPHARLSVSGGEGCRLTRLEVALRYGDPVQCGYF